MIDAFVTTIKRSVNCQSQLICFERENPHPLIILRKKKNYNYKPLKMCPIETNEDIQMKPAILHENEWISKINEKNEVFPKWPTKIVKCSREGKNRAKDQFIAWWTKREWFKGRVSFCVFFLEWKSISPNEAKIHKPTPLTIILIAKIYVQLKKYDYFENEYKSIYKMAGKYAWPFPKLPHESAATETEN